MARNRVRGMHSGEIRGEKKGEKVKNPKPENLLNDGTSNGLVALAVPCPPHALVRPRPWAWHLRNGSVEPDQTTQHTLSFFFFLSFSHSVTHTHTNNTDTQHTKTIWEVEMDRNN